MYIQVENWNTLWFVTSPFLPFTNLKYQLPERTNKSINV